MFYFSLVNLMFLTILLTRSPFMMSVMVILISILFSAKIYLMAMDWFMYTLIIMFLGGMMIMFTYASSVSSVFKMNIFYSKPVLYTFLATTTWSASNCLMGMKASTSPWIAFSTVSLFLIILMVVLIISVLFIVVKLVQMNEGPLKMD